MSDFTKKIIETVPIFFFIYGLDEREVTFVSPQFYELAEGVEKGDQHALKQIIHPDYQDAFDCFFDELAPENNYEASTELKVSDSLKGIEWIELNTFPVQERSGSTVKQVVGHIVNVTEKKLMYDVLLEEKEHISNILNMVVHDLRAPFDKVHMISEILERNMSEEEHRKYKPYLSILLKQKQHADALIESLLRLATLKGNAASLDLNMHDLRTLVAENVAQQQEKLAQRKLSVKYLFPEEHVKAKVDAVLFSQVLENLLSNAIKYTPAGGVIRYKLANQHQHVLLTIEDNGIGIPEKHQASLFKSFSNIKRKGLQGEASVGLGLFICKEIVKMHQGEIWVKSKEGEGASFIISLPIPESSAAYY